MGRCCFYRCVCQRGGAGGSKGPHGPRSLPCSPAPCPFREFSPVLSLGGGEGSTPCPGWGSTYCPGRGRIPLFLVGVTTPPPHQDKGPRTEQNRDGCTPYAVCLLCFPEDLLEVASNPWGTKLLFGKLSSKTA